MEHKTYNIINIPLTLAILAMALFVAWHWGAPWALRISYKAAAPELANACSHTSGCKRVLLHSQWRPVALRYEPVAEVRFSSMVDKNKLELADAVRNRFNEAAGRSLFYREPLRALTIEFHHE